MHQLDIESLGFHGLIAREWLTTNGQGSYATSTLAGMNTRKYHGLLVAAMAPPVRRMVILSRVEESIHSAGHTFDLATNEYPGTLFPQGHQFLRAFNHEPFPRWAFQADGWTIEKQVRLLQGENTVIVSYALLAATRPVELELRPLLALRGIHELMYQWNGRLDAQPLEKRHHRIPPTTKTPEVFFAHDGTFSPQAYWYLNNLYRREHERGYAATEDLWMPGAIRWTVQPGQVVHFVCSTEPIHFDRAVAEAQRQYDSAVVTPVIQSPEPAVETLARAAEQFIVATRDTAPTIVAGYPWPAPCVRDALISLPGLLLITGRIEQARAFLQTCAAAIRDGLVPSELAEDGSGYRYDAADTSLWFIHAAGEFLRYRGDAAFVRDTLLPAANRIIDAYRNGTELGIAIDPDGLLRVNSRRLPATWMDAVTGDAVITPRNGRPVELSALWYNALCTTAAISRRFAQAPRAAELLVAADRTREGFNRRFWNSQAWCCFDVLSDEANDDSLRPNQLLAMSLPFPVLNPDRHEMALDTITRDLLTPVGLRTLSPGDPAYRGTYAGPPISRDRAYHQGSAYPWLLGPLVTAQIRHAGGTEVSRIEARRKLQASIAHMRSAGTGQLCELFDGDPPHAPGGAPASARSVAELLRCYVQDVLNLVPPAIDSLPPDAPSSPQPSNHDAASLTRDSE